MVRLMQEVKYIIADVDNELTVLIRNLVQWLLSHLRELNRQVQEIDNENQALSRQSSVRRRLEQMPRIGSITATALAATVGHSIHECRNGRQLAAFLGLVPKQHPAAVRNVCKAPVSGATAIYVDCFCTALEPCCTTLCISWNAAAAAGWRNWLRGET
jgi:transposase